MKKYLLFFGLGAVLLFFGQHHKYKIEKLQGPETLSVAPGSSITLVFSEYFSGEISEHELKIVSGPQIKVEQKGMDYELKVPKDLRGYRIELQLKVKNLLSESIQNISVYTEFLGDIHGIALSNSTSCLNDDFGIFCWGGDHYRQASGAPLHFSKDAVLYGKGNHFCGFENQRLTCWGDIELDVLLRDASLISVGEGAVCYLDAGQLQCKASGSGYKIGKDIPYDLPNVIDIAIGGDFACYIDEMRQVECWGENRRGVLSVPINLIYPSKIVAGYSHACVLDAGQIKCWGDIETNDKQPRLGTVKNMAANGYRLCAEDESGWHCWLLGSKDVGWYNHSKYVDVDKITIGRNAICSIKYSNLECDGLMQPLPSSVFGPKNLVQSARMVGFVDQGRLTMFGEQDNRKSRRFEKYKLLARAGEVVDIALESTKHKACARFEHGGAKCIDRSAGHKIVREFERSPESFGVYATACALIDGQAECWGDTPLANEYKPPLLSNPKKIVVSGVSNNDFACALDDTGIHCWGSNEGGRLDSPSSSSFIDFDLNGNAGCALSSDRAICWGDNARLAEMMDSRFNNAVSISLGYQRACINDNGSANCWSGSREGNSPNRLVDVVELTSGVGQNCAIDAGGVTCWGDNYLRYGLKPQI